MAGVYIVSELGGSHEISLYPMVFFGLGNLLSLPLADPLAQRVGTVRLLIHGLLLYTLFSILCGLASTFVVFNLYRLGLGIASGLFYVLCRNLMVAYAPEEKKADYTLFATLIYIIAPVLGASFGAWVAYDSHWRWIFHVNEGISLGLALYFWRRYRHLDTPAAMQPPLDKIGYCCYAAAISSLLTAATLAQELDWFRSPLFVGLLIIGIPSALFFMIWELRHPNPLIDVRLLLHRKLCYALCNFGILFSSYFGMIILIPLWLNIYANYTPLWIAALIGIMAGAGVIAYGITHSVLGKLDPRWSVGIAILCFASSCYYSTYFNVEIDFFHLAIARLLAGLGLMLFALPLINLFLTCHGEGKALPVFVLFQTFRSLSGSLGVALYVILWQRRQVFFRERLGEGITPDSPLTLDYLHRAVHEFHLTADQALAELGTALDTQATSLALNDVFCCMGWLVAALFIPMALSLFKRAKIF